MNWGDMIVLVWKGKWEIHMLMSMHVAPAENNFCDKHRYAIKPAILANYTLVHEI
jgi:hypothetical protein